MIFFLLILLGHDGSSRCVFTGRETYDAYFDAYRFRVYFFQCI